MAGIRVKIEPTIINRVIENVPSDKLSQNIFNIMEEFMSIKQQIIDDIELLPDHTLQAISIIVKEFILLNNKIEAKPRPIFGSGKGLMYIANDFDEPLDELKEYME